MKVYLEPAWKLPASYRHMIDFPPTGYEFVVAPEREKFFKSVSRWQLSYTILNTIDNVIPLALLKSRLQRWRKPPAGTVLTWALHQLVFRPEPWVVELEYASILLGPRPKHLRRYGSTLERMLASPHCKKIRCWCEAGRKTIVSGLNSEKFQHKIELIYPAVPARKFVKHVGGGRVKLLFVGSPNIKGQFVDKGGLEVLETFALLRQRYNNLEMVIRSDMPEYVKSRYGCMENLRIMDKVIPWEMMEREYQSADIFIIPSHSTPPYTMLDAMSFELPLVSINAWANPEIIEDGKTGLLAERSRKVPYYYGDTPHPNYNTPDFIKAIRTPDSEVVGAIAQKVSLLIENPGLRRRMGQAGRYEVEKGRFSIAARNERLGKFFDEATQ